MESGTKSKEIEDLLFELKDSTHKHSTVTAAPKKTGNSTLEILNTPLTIPVTKDNTPLNYEQVLADRGDHLVVFAYAKNRAEVVAYNPRNQTAGRFPADHLANQNSTPFSESKLYMTKSDLAKMFNHVAWKAGDYVRVWNKTDAKYTVCSGLCCPSYRAHWKVPR